MDGRSSGSDEPNGVRPRRAMAIRDLLYDHVATEPARSRKNAYRRLLITGAGVLIVTAIVLVTICHVSAADA